MGMDTRPQILLIEDNHDDRREMEALIAGVVDAKILHADSVIDGVRKLTANPIDCVILDLGLVGSKGHDTVAAFLSTSTWSGPVIVCTISDDANTERDCVARGWSFVCKDRDSYRADFTRAFCAVTDSEGSKAETASHKQRVALAGQLDRMERRQNEMDGKLDKLVSALEDMRLQRLGYWTKDDKGRDVWVDGCLTVCQEMQKLLESGKAIGGQAISKLSVAAITAVGTLVLTAVGAILTHVLGPVAAK